MAKLAYAVVLTRNVEGLAAFYREVLQVEPQWSGPYAEFTTDGASLGLWSVEAYAEIAGASALPEPGTGPIMLEFEVPDVDSKYAQLQRLADFSVEFIIPPTTVAWGNRSIYFRDPDSNLLNLFSRVASSS